MRWRRRVLFALYAGILLFGKKVVEVCRHVLLFSIGFSTKKETSGQLEQTVKLLYSGVFLKIMITTKNNPLKNRQNFENGIGLNQSSYLIVPVRSQVT